MPEEFKPIDFNAPANKADADKPKDQSTPEDSKKEPLSRSLVNDAEVTEAAQNPKVDPTKDPHLKEENKLPPANELEADEEDPEMRKIAGEAPHITAARPDAFTKEVDGGVVKEDPKKEGVITGDRKSEEKPPTTSTPVLS